MIILFVIAMKVEFLFLLNKFEDVSEKKLGIYTYYEFKSKDKTIYILHSNIGDINTSISLSKFLSIVKPDIIINAGTSGAHDKKLNVGDIVLAKEAVNINCMETVFKDLNEGSKALDWKMVTFLDDEENLEGDYKVNYGDNELIEKIKNIGNDLDLTIYEGRVASGDIWNKEKDRINLLNEKYFTLCEEMELFSVYTICKQENIPCIGIKIISNNEMNGQSYDKNISEKLDEFLYNIIIELDKSKTLLIVLIVVGSIVLIGIIVIILYIYFRKKRKRGNKVEEITRLHNLKDNNQKLLLDSQENSSPA